jgi:putative endonuclease
MTETSVLTGKNAELLAEQYLVSAGFRILARNFRCTRGEIDIVALDYDTLVFVEVRCRTFGYNAALESVTREKRRRLTYTAQYYLARNPSELPCRFDVICVSGNPMSVLHTRAAFNLNDI